MKLTPESINIILAIATPILLWIAKRLGSKLPKPWARFLTELEPADIDEAVTAVGTSKGRDKYARETVRKIALKYNIVLDEFELDTIIFYLLRLWQAGVKVAGRTKSNLNR